MFRFALVVIAFSADAATSTFEFGSEKQIKPTTTFTKQLGYGFEQSSELRAASDYITSTTPFFFSVAIPEGSYRVTVTLGDRNGTSQTTVKAELRRLMIENAQTAKGKIEKRSFLVNVRRPEISTGGVVRLKDREKTLEWVAWDDKLTLEFSDAAPKLRAIEIEPVNNVPTIFIAGDSTSTDQPKEPYNSWGQMITRFFKPDVVVANHGESGESLSSFNGEKRAEKLMSLVKPGDWLLIQMGHNDQKEKGEGAGAFTTYKAALKKMVADARQRGVHPVLVTPMHRLNFDENGKIVQTLGDYPEAVRQAANEDGVPLIDLNAMSKPFYEALGPANAERAFAPNDKTHHNNYGSYQLAKCIVEGIRQNRLALAKHVVDGLPKYDPARPDPLDKFRLPASPAPIEAQRPLGN